MIVVEDLHKHFGGFHAVDGASLEIEKGSITGLIGPNGAGKSSLLLHLNGSLRPDQGRVLLDGAPALYSRSALTDWRRRVALVLQDPDDQLFAATVFEDISFGPLNLGLSAQDAAERVEEALAALSIEELRDRPTHMLSGGQKQRVAIAGAVAMRPEVLLLDEPTAGLDTASAAQLLTLLNNLNASGMTLVFSTHDVELAWQLADDIALFKDGRCLTQGAPETLLSDHDALARSGMLDGVAATDNRTEKRTPQKANFVRRRSRPPSKEAASVQRIGLLSKSSR